MATHLLPKTLAKTLTTLTIHTPGEYGLFWDPDGTMPWKELYWAMQEDPTLRFVRESHLRELTYLGLELPFVLEGNRLHLKADAKAQADYPVDPTPPERLYHACRRKHYLVVMEHGLTATSRAFVPLATSRELALRIGKRRDPESILIEVRTRTAAADGMVFRKAGPELTLVESLPVEHLVFPQMRDEELSRIAPQQKKEKKAARPDLPSTPGSFFIETHHLEVSSPDRAAAGKSKKKGARGAQWKRESRKERGKRTV